jgi:hypothetical protein
LTLILVGSYLPPERPEAMATESQPNSIPQPRRLLREDAPVAVKTAWPSAEICGSGSLKGQILEPGAFLIDMHQRAFAYAAIVPTKNPAVLYIFTDRMIVAPGY